MATPRTFLFAIIVMAGCLTALAPRAGAAVFTVGPPGATAGCTHATIQAAVDAAAAAAGPDTIRLTRGVYPAQRLLIADDQPLDIEGGFSACTSTARVDTSTLDGLGASPVGPVIQHTGVARLRLSDLVLSNGNALDSGATAAVGGGVSSPGWGDLEIYRSRLLNNRARDGGGLYAGALLRTPKSVHLEDVDITGNMAGQSGGGLYVLNVALHVTGEHSSRIAGNETVSTVVEHGGGAMYAVNADVYIDASSPAGTALIEGNATAGSGGAIQFVATLPGDFDLRLTTRRGRTPVAVVDNIAAGHGGAVSLRATATGGTNINARLVDTVLSSNQAPSGSAVHVSAADAAGATNRASMRLLAGDACPRSARCNRIDNSFGSRAPFHVLQSGTGRADLRIQRAYLIDNVAADGPNGDAGGNGLIWGSGGSYIYVDNSVLGNNDLGDAMLVRSPGGEVRVENSTIAGNFRVEPSLFRLYSTNDELRVGNSIVFEPGTRIVLATAGASFELFNLLVGEGHGLGSLTGWSNIHLTLDPMFVNHWQSDFNILPGSPAIDRWSTSTVVNPPVVDITGATRAAFHTGTTPYDFGAYESGAIVDSIFPNGFE